jgi:RNA polymerase sigma-70 factor (ECF subfamily)
LIGRARQGDENALGQLLDGHRAYLKMLAQRSISGRLEARVDASDLVQQTFLSAFRNIKEFTGDDEAQFVAWLRTIHQRNIHDTIRRNVHAQKRSIVNEQSLDDSQLGEGSGSSASPSQRAMQGEQAVQLANALQTLPEDQREAVRLRHLEGWSLAQLAEHFKRSEDAVAALLKRGLENLRKRLRD